MKNHPYNDHFFIKILAWKITDQINSGIDGAQ